MGTKIDNSESNSNMVTLFYSLGICWWEHNENKIDNKAPVQENESAIGEK